MNGKNEKSLNHFFKCFICGNRKRYRCVLSRSETNSFTSCAFDSFQRERKKLRHARLRDAPGTISDVLSRSEINGFKSPTFDATRAEEGSACRIARCLRALRTCPLFHPRPCGGEHFFTCEGAPATLFSKGPLARRRVRHYLRKCPLRGAFDSTRVGEASTCTLA